MKQDFSELHAPTGALGFLPAHEQDWQQYRLGDEQVEAFHRDGFLTGVQVLDDHQVDVASLAWAVPRVPLERIQQPGYDSVSRTGRVADRAGVSRRAVESGVSGGGLATAGGGGAVLA
jgi:hypothetical protein